MRYKLGFALMLLVIAVAAFWHGAEARDNMRERATGAQGVYVFVPPKPVRTYPSPYARIQGWINTDDSTAIRAHAWDIWQSITARTLLGQPTWQTWYSGHELFEANSDSTRAKARAVHGLVQFEMRPLPPGHRSPMARTASGIPFDLNERTFAFNRFTRSTAQFIWNKQLNNGNVLRDTLMKMTASGTPISQQEVLTSADSTDAASFVLKAVFQFISGTEVTAVPVWAGNDTAVTYDTLNPVPSRWRHAVAVDPTGRHTPGDSVTMVVNNEAAVKLLVVPLSAFYYVKITKADSVNFSTFGPINGDFIGVANDTSAQAVYMAMRPGNIGLLMAMHVTGKEVPNWTWQSYWWGLNPHDPEYGADRPATIPAPWNHYNMTVAYSMTHPDGTPRIAFNPYLETSLEGNVPNGPGNPKDSTYWTGVTSNCMSCHRRAAIGWGGGNSVTAPTPVTPPYGPAGFVNAGDSVIFTQPVNGVAGRVPVLKTDFLWSVAIRSSGPTAGKR